MFQNGTKESPNRRESRKNLVRIPSRQVSHQFRVSSVSKHGIPSQIIKKKASGYRFITGPRIFKNISRIPTRLRIWDNPDSSSCQIQVATKSLSGITKISKNLKKCPETVLESFISILSSWISSQEFIFGRWRIPIQIRGHVKFRWPLNPGLGSQTTF